MIHLYPDTNGLCACGGGVKLDGRNKRWASPTCAEKAYLEFAVIKGNNSIIRSLVFSRDKGVCNNCGHTKKDWHADHILPVHKGGGACTLDNFQTLCLECHSLKTWPINRSILVESPHMQQLGLLSYDDRHWEQSCSLA
jgi:hypothetical protein